jgi:Arc/MetJ-type ribon-helix-helix transcriptional regulator
MPGKSKSSRIVSVRLPNEVIEVLQRRVKENRFTGIPSYLRDRITYDTLRRHGKGKRK